MQYSRKNIGHTPGIEPKGAGYVLAAVAMLVVSIFVSIAFLPVE